MVSAPLSMAPSMNPAQHRDPSGPRHAAAVCEFLGRPPSDADGDAVFLFPIVEYSVDA